MANVQIGDNASPKRCGKIGRKIVSSTVEEATSLQTKLEVVEGYAVRTGGYLFALFRHPFAGRRRMRIELQKPLHPDLRQTNSLDAPGTAAAAGRR